MPPTQDQYASYFSIIRGILEEQRGLVSLSRTRGQEEEVGDELEEIRRELRGMLHERRSDEMWLPNFRRLHVIEQALRAIRHTLTWTRPSGSRLGSSSSSRVPNSAVPPGVTHSSDPSWDALISQARASKIPRVQSDNAQTRAPSAPQAQVLCPLCSEREQTHVFCPCGHFGYCQPCAARLTRCPTCMREGSAIRLWRVSFGSRRR